MLKKTSVMLLFLSSIFLANHLKLVSSVVNFALEFGLSKKYGMLRDCSGVSLSSFSSSSSKSKCRTESLRSDFSIKFVIKCFLFIPVIPARIVMFGVERVTFDLLTYAHR